MDDDHKFTGPSADDPLDTRPDDGIDALGISAAETETPEVFRVGRPGGRRAFLQTLSKSAAVGTAAVVTDNCSTTQPTPTSTTTSSTTSVRTTTTTTTVASTFTLAGVVKDTSGKPVVGARVFVVDGPNANKGSTTDGNGYYSIPGLVVSSFTLRTTYNGTFLYDIPITVSKDTRLDFTTPIPTASTTSVSGGGGGGGGHYWYPN